MPRGCGSALLNHNLRTVFFLRFEELASGKPLRIEQIPILEMWGSS